MERSPQSRREPAALGDVLSQLFALRGYGRVRGDRQLQDVWRTIAGDQIASQTRVIGVKNGVLNVAVSTSALLSELAAFHKFSLLDRLASAHPELKITDLKFKLRGNMSSPRG